MTAIPRWLELQAEIDCRLFLLGEMRREDERLTPFDRLIDEATGHDEARLAEAKVIIAEIGTLKAELDALTAEDSDMAETRLTDADRRILAHLADLDAAARDMDALRGRYGTDTTVAALTDGLGEALYLARELAATVRRLAGENDG